MTRYHVTPTRNLESIFNSGINPEYSQGKRRVCWYVSKARLTWAIAHVSARHNVSVQDITVLSITDKIRNFGLTCWPGVYTHASILLPHRWAPATTFVRPLEDENDDPACGPTDGEAAR